MRAWCRSSTGCPSRRRARYPRGISLDQADGNSVVLDLGSRRFALYAHLQPGSITVKAGDRVQRGQVLGKVGNTGNSVAPHLHFHVMDGPLPVDANGLPYAIDSFWITGHAASTEAFDMAEAKGSPLAMTAVDPPRKVSKSLPMDLSIVGFDRYSRPWPAR